MGSRSYSNSPYPSPSTPLLPATKQSISLPALSAYPVHLHPILQSRTSSFMTFDLNKHPSSITLHPHVMSMAAQQQQGWLSAPATFPSNICSLTIRIAGVDRPLVIVAATKAQQGLSTTSFITVWDVLFACHRAWGQAKAERNRSTCFSHRYSPFNIDFQASERLLLASSSKEEDKYRPVSATYMNAVRSDDGALMDCYFRNSSHWDGLMRSETEPDVWVLYTSFRAGGQ